ncbi:hypothetical protein HUJ04_013275 [Dendroctonus ponderosae]|nr:hypothetical protein HUJ04_013275 [Dendroctonus ponderosae]
MGVSETHWPNSGQCKILDHTVYIYIIIGNTTGDDNNSQHRNELDDAVIDEFYEQLERLIKMANKQEITIIMGVCQAPQGISDSVKETKEETILYSSARIITYYSNNIDIGKLSDRNIRKQVQELLTNDLKKINNNTSKAQGKWDKFENSIQANCEKHLQKDKNKKQEWMAQEILDMMDERRKHEDHGLNLNISKTKWMVVSKDQTHNERITLKDQTIERVESYKYHRDPIKD